MKIAAKRMICLFVILGLLASLVACSMAPTEAAPEQSAQSPAAEAGAEQTSDEPIKLKFAYCVDGVDLAQQSNYDFAQGYVDYLNSVRKDLQIELVLMDGQSSVDKQIGDVDTAISMGVDGIILSCADPSGLTPITKEAMAAGIPVLDWRDMGDVCTITLDMGTEAGRGVAAYEWFCEYLESNPDVILNVGLQYGSAAQTAQIPRVSEIKKVAEEYPDRFNIVVEQYGDWGADTSMKMTEDWIQVYDLNCIVTANEEMMVGASEALRGANVIDNFLLLCFNGDQTGIDMIKDGTIDVDVGKLMNVGMALLIEYAVNMTLDGLTGHYDVAGDVMYTITEENVDEYIAARAPDYAKGLFKSTLKESYK